MEMQYYEIVELHFPSINEKGAVKKNYIWTVEGSR